MIRNVIAGTGIHVVGGDVAGGPYIDSTRPSAGMLRYIGNNIEVYDGSGWLQLQSGYPQVELAPPVQAVVVWAQCKMAEETRIKALAAMHPAVEDALAAVTRAEEQLRVVTALVETE